MSDILNHYRESGEGRPLVLLHGNGESSEYFEGQIGYFKEKYRVIAIDTRGHGHSPRGNAPFTLSQFAEDLKNFLDSLGIRSCCLLGFSDGANIALLFALKYPDYIDALILNGANLYPSGVKFSVQLPVYLGFALLSLISVFDRRAAAKREMLALMATQPHINPRELGTLKMPVLVIVGTRDMIKDRHSALIAASVPGCRFERVEGNHFVASENSRPFNETVADFLSSFRL